MSDTLAMIIADKGSNVYSVRPEMTISQTVAEMNKHNVGSMIVLDDGTLVGIFTERDVLTRVIPNNFDPKTTRVSHVMTNDPVTLLPEQTVDDTMELMREKRCRHLPLIKHGKVAGLISIGDIVRWISRKHEYEADALKAYIDGAYG